MEVPFRDDRASSTTARWPAPAGSRGMPYREGGTPICELVELNRRILNVDLPVYIDRAVDLACHEGYPGHHVYNALLEQHLVRGRGWHEFSVYPLFSPHSLIAEGTANYGITM